MAQAFQTAYDYVEHSHATEVPVMSSEQLLDLTPSPRVLRMLGQIDFKPWQCLAELIDNSVDAFIASQNRTALIIPQINVEVSSVAEIKTGAGKIQISDNGPGMAPDRLKDAVRAGFSGNNSIDKLGVFGMGFNVATARLGTRTEVWTTRREDDYWTGIRIDFEAMELAGSFQAPALSRRKSATESQVHGTEIIISKLEPERALYLRTGAGLRTTKDKLNRIYNKIMRDMQLVILVCGNQLEAREFCVWGADKHVDTRTDFGRIPAILNIDANLGDRLYCEDCWCWLLEAEKSCPVCLSSSHLRNRARKIIGWIGVQRYFDQQDYGIDLIRNGRVIEERSKAFFSWQDPDSGTVVPEYPLEQQHWGGRIVGELNVDFVPLASHQKDAFNRQTPEWRLVEKAIHGEGPILVERRKSAGFANRNDSPLARLHTGYRRGNPPGFRWLVPGDSTGKGINEQPRQWAGLFWNGELDYKSDEKWWEAVKLAEEVHKKRGADVPVDQTGGAGFGPGPEKPPGTLPPPKPVITQVLDREPDPTVSGTFELPEINGCPRLEVKGNRLVNGSLLGKTHIEFAIIGSLAEFTYDLRHLLFATTLLEPVDCLIEELGYQILQRSNTTQKEWPLSRITQALRRKYYQSTIISMDQVQESAASLLADMVEHYQQYLPSLAPLDSAVLDASSRDALSREVARIDHAGRERVEEVICGGEFPRYLGVRYLTGLIEQWPAVLMDSNFLAVGYTDVALDIRGEGVRGIVSAVRDLLWVMDPGGATQGGAEWRSMLGRAASSLRLLDAWKA